MADLPGDNPAAQRARGRRTAGLGAAGGGYLMASRAGDVAPGMADLFTRSPKKIGAVKHAARTASRAKRITRVGTRGGAVLVVGGLGLAGEGAVSDLRNRKAFSRGRQQVHQQVRDTVQEHVGKGLGMTLSDEIGKAGWGKAISGAVKPITTGISGAVKPIGAAIKGFQGGGAKLGTGMLGPAAAPLGQRLKPIGSAIKGAVKPIGATLKPISNGRLTPVGMAGAGAVGVGGAIGVDRHFRKSYDRPKKDRKTLKYVGAAVGGNAAGSIVGGLAGMPFGVQGANVGASLGGTAGLVGGIMGYQEHRRKHHMDSPVARRTQQRTLAKAFDSERDRRDRQNTYAGAASGGAVLAGAGSAVAGRRAFISTKAGRRSAGLSIAAHDDVQSRLEAMTAAPKPPARAKKPKAAATNVVQPTPVGAKGAPAKAITPPAPAAAPAAGKTFTDAQKKAFRTVDNLKEVKDTHHLGVAHGRSALGYAARGRKLTRVSIGAGLGAAALGGAAYRIHDRDRRQINPETNYGY